MKIIVDGTKRNQNENMLYRGAGIISANNSSRLLLDYKYEHPEAYWKILNYIFGENGVSVTHLKIEMGSDINSSSGTEPSVKRTAKEVTDVTRGAGYQLAADAKTINPQLTLDMLWWSEPKWISDAKNLYAARYTWYKETLDAAYETYGLQFDYVSAVQNEREADYEWIKYLSRQLKAEKDCPYDYSKIKIVGGEEVCTWGFADRMLEDEELLHAVDVIGSHYTSQSTPNAQKLAQEYHKELWFSEASSPMNYAKGTYRVDGKNSGIADLNGTLDIANRMIAMYPMGKMTLYEYQPLVSAYYDGVTYCHKQLISACDPWSGYFHLDSGFYMSLHFSQFIKKGWLFVDGACYADGKTGGDGHAIVDATYSYMSASDPQTGDYSVVITNTTSETITYEFDVRNLQKASSNVSVWETRGPEHGDYDENYFRKITTITPTKEKDNYQYTVMVRPYSIVTISTLVPKCDTYNNLSEDKKTVLSLPYTDDYEYKEYPSNYLSKRGNAPRYTTDEGGAFEVVIKDNAHVLMQMITPEIKSKEWGATPEPTTNFGDDRWFNYQVLADVNFIESDNKATNYVGIGLRYSLADAGKSGYWLQLYEDGTCKLNRNSETMSECKLEVFDPRATHNLMIQAMEDKIIGFVDSCKVLDYVSKSEALLCAGRAAFYSSYHNNYFAHLKVEKVKGYQPYIKRMDNTDRCFSYSNNWSHNLMSSFKNYKRTISTGSENDVVTISFDGSGFAITGENQEEAVIHVTVDGEVIEKGYKVAKNGPKEISYYRSLSEAKNHVVKITVLAGKYSIDSIEIKE